MATDMFPRGLGVSRNRPGNRRPTRPAMIYGARRPGVPIRALKGVVLFAICACVLFPFVLMFATSFADTTQAARSGGYVLWPDHPTLSAYRQLFEGQIVPRALLVSIGITVVGTALSILVVTTLAYSLSRPGSFGHSKVLMFVLLTMLFASGMIPNYLLIKSLGLIDSYWALILPSLANTFNVIVVRGFFLDLPEELLDAGRVDGAGDLAIFVKIVLPLSRAAIAVIGLFSAVSYWNAYFNAILYMNSQDKWPIQVVMRSYVIDSQSMMQATNSGAITLASPQALSMAILVISLVPIAIVFPFLRRHFAKGFLLGAVKG